MKRSCSKLIAKQSLPWLAMLCSVLLFGLHFFAGGGRSKLITDSQAYLLMSEGQHPHVPFSSRILAPFFASLLSSISGVSNQTAFQILTAALLLASLLLLQKLIRDSGGSLEWQAAVLLSFGCGLGVTFGYTPVMVDPLLLFFTCLAAIGLQSNRFALAIASATLATLTKEYGLLLGVVVGVLAYRDGRPRVAFAAALLPVIALLGATSISGLAGGSDSDWGSFVSAMFGYHAQLFRFRGAVAYPQLLYMWSWSVVWPVLVIAGGVVISRIRNRRRLTAHEVAFLSMLAAMPILLLGDWGRALLIAVPFGCIIATSHSLSGKPYFAVLLGIAGLSTALARPFHGDLAPPRGFTLVMTGASVLASLLIGLTLLQLAALRKNSQHSQSPTKGLPEAAVPS